MSYPKINYWKCWKCKRWNWHTDNKCLCGADRSRLTTAFTPTVGDSANLSKSFTLVVSTNPEGDPIPPASR